MIGELANGDRLAFGDETGVAVFRDQARRADHAMAFEAQDQALLQQ